MEEEQVEAETRTQSFFKPSFVLIAIDTSPSMFITRENEDGSSTHCFKDCLTACYEIAESLIFTQNKKSWSQFAVILAYDDDKAGFVEFETNLLDAVKALNITCNMSNEALKTTYERNYDLDLGAFFLKCKSMFKNIKGAFYKRTLIFVTNDDNPVKNDANRKFTVLNEVKTFESSDITLEVVTMRDDFDYKIFFNELYSVYNNPNVYEEVCEDKDGLFEKLSNAVIQRYTKRKLNIYPFVGDTERYIKCLKMKFIQEAKLYNNAKVSQEGKLLKRIRKNTFEKPANQNFKISTTYFDEFTLNFEDRYSILNNDLPVGLNLLYVSNRNTDVGFVLSAPSLLQIDPKEDLPFYEQFWQYCVDNDKVLVCLRKYKQPDKIRYVELIPKYANNKKMFLIKGIPFATEIKYPKKTDKETETCNDPEKLQSVGALIEKLTFDYHPKMLPNPSYAKKKAYIKAKLLDEAMDEVVDISCNEREMDKNIEEIISNLEIIFRLQDSSKGKKRKETTTSGKGRGAKKIK